MFQHLLTEIQRTLPTQIFSLTQYLGCVREFVRAVLAAIVLSAICLKGYPTIGKVKFFNGNPSLVPTYDAKLLSPLPLFRIITGTNRSPVSEFRCLSS